jgi:hypothetical protein
VQTQALSNRLSFRSEPLGTISFDSPLQPPAVLENLRARGREWRATAIPEDLRKRKVGNLLVEIEGAGFQMRWTGVNPFFNPTCFGTVQPYRDGSRIRAGFKLYKRDFVFIGAAFAGAVFPLLMGRWSTFYLGYFGLMVIFLSAVVLKNRTSEPMRTRLVEVLEIAAGRSTNANDAFSAANAGSQPRALL